MKQWWRLVLLALVGIALARCGSLSPSARETTNTAPTMQATPRATASATQSGLRQVPVRNLPPEANATLTLIAQGGPFPYDRDGITFQNRERLLPRKPAGYYREYTVPTPGENDRGARRLITGNQGEVYYTADHYASFVEVVP